MSQKLEIVVRQQQCFDGYSILEPLAIPSAAVAKECCPVPEVVKMEVWDSLHHIIMFPSMYTSIKGRPSPEPMQQSKPFRGGSGCGIARVVVKIEGILRSLTNGRLMPSHKQAIQIQLYVSLNS